MSSSQNGGLASKEPLSGAKSRQGLQKGEHRSPTSTQSLTHILSRPLGSHNEQMTLGRQEKTLSLM